MVCRLDAGPQRRRSRTRSRARRPPGRRADQEQIQQAARDSVHAIMMIAYRMQPSPRQTRSAASPPTRITRSCIPRPTYAEGSRSQDLHRSRARSRIRDRQRDGRDPAHLLLDHLTSSSCISDPHEKGLRIQGIEGPDRPSPSPRGRQAGDPAQADRGGRLPKKFIDVKYTPAPKRFGLGSGEAPDPTLREQIIQKRGSNLGVKEIVFSIAHRGHLNDADQVLGKPASERCSTSSRAGPSPRTRSGRLGRRQVSPRRLVGP